jgi:hypothetical protein
VLGGGEAEGGREGGREGMREGGNEEEVLVEREKMTEVDTY